MADPKPQKPGAISERPLWVIALMFVLHIVALTFCALWIPSTYGKAITQRFGSPLFIFPPVIFAYAIVPLVASFSKLGRDYWDLLGRGGSARRAAVTLLIVGTASTALLAAMWHAAA
jgi:hypothetical protein